MIQNSVMNIKLRFRTSIRHFDALFDKDACGKVYSNFDYISDMCSVQSE